MPDKTPGSSTGKYSNKYSKASSTTAVLVTIIALCVIGFLVWWFGFRNTTSSYAPVTNQPSSSQQASAVKTTWTNFFNGSTPLATREQLLQNGSQYAQELAGYSQSPLAKEASATVTDVKVNGNTATVTYTINVNGQPELPNQTGEAVLVNGEWKVSDTALCGLLKLAGGQTPPVCSSASGSSSSSGSSASGSSSTSGSSSSNSGASKTLPPTASGTPVH